MLAGRHSVIKKNNQIFNTRLHYAAEDTTKSLTIGCDVYQPVDASPEERFQMWWQRRDGFVQPLKTATEIQKEKYGYSVDLQPKLNLIASRPSTLTCICRCCRVDPPGNVEGLTLNRRSQSLEMSGIYVFKAGTSPASRASEDRTSESLLSSGDSNRKSNTPSTTTSFSGGAGRGSSSNSAVWFGVRSCRSSSCTRQTQQSKVCSAEKAKFVVSIVGPDLPLICLD